MTLGNIEPFPWKTLPGLRRGSVRVRRVLADNYDLERLRAAGNELLKCSVGAWGFMDAADAQPGDVWPRCTLSLPGIELTVSVEPALATLLVSRISQTTVALDNGQALSPGLYGAYLATVQALSRRAARGEPPQCSAPTSAEQASADETTEAWSAPFFVHLDGGSYRGSLSAAVTPQISPRARGRSQERSRALPVRLEAAVAMCSLDVLQVQTLEVGDIVVPEVGWLEDGYWLSAPNEEYALLTRTSADVLRFSRCVPFELSPVDEAEAPAEVDRKEVPRVIARFEVGSLTLSAERWLTLQAGDPLPNIEHYPIDCILRVSGKRMAWGRRVEIDGTLGLRVVGLIPEAPARRPWTHALRA